MKMEPLGMQYCQLLIAILILIGLSHFQPTASTAAAAAAPSCTDELEQLIKGVILTGEFRFQYELDVYKQGELKSLLIDEAYSDRTRSGRLLLNHGALSDTSAFSMFYWTYANKKHESHWLRQFVCHTAQSEERLGPMQSGFLFSILPFRLELKNAFVHFDPNEPQLSFQGLSALLVNLFVSTISPISKSVIEEHHSGRPEEGGLCSWTITPQAMANFNLEVSMTKSNPSGPLEAQDLASLRLKFNRFSEAIDSGKDRIVAQMTVLNFEQNFARSLVQLPQGYSCTRSLVPTGVDLAKLRLTATRRTKYVYEATVTTGDYMAAANGLASDHYAGSVPAPSDSLVRPQSQSRSFELLHDDIEDILAIVDSRSKARAVFRSKQQEAAAAAAAAGQTAAATYLSIWDFSTRKLHRVSLETGQCSPAKSFVSSLFGGKQLDRIKAAPNGFKSGCLLEQVELRLSDWLRLKLNQDGLQLLTFTFQDFTNYMQLVDYEQTPTGAELTYERSVNDKFCLVDAATNNLISHQAIRLVSRYSFEAKSQQLLPRSSSLLFFDSSQRQLLLQVDLNLLHYEPFQPWSRARHLLDLSGCKLGFKESARVRLEYPLTDESRHLRDVAEPHAAIRSALATNMRLAFGLTLLRLPSIEVDIADDSVQVELHILERASLLSECAQLDVLDPSTSDAKYIGEYLNKASRSVLTDDVNQCADYCQLYQCELFAFCNLVHECYIYTDPSFLLVNNLFGSYRSPQLNCDAYSVPKERIDSANKWKKSSWSLEEIVDTLMDSINSIDLIEESQPTAGSGESNRTSNESSEQQQQPKDTAEGDALENSISGQARFGSSAVRMLISLVASVNKGLSRMIRMAPAYAEYQYDNLHSTTSIASKRLQLNPFNLIDQPNSRQATRGAGGAKDGGPPPPPAEIEQHDMTNNFKIIKTGYSFIDISPIQISQSSAIRANDLADDDSGLLSSTGHLIVEHQRLEDCLRLCLSDLSCASLSYCTDATLACTLSSLNRTDVESLLATGAVRRPPPPPTATGDERPQQSASSLALHQDPRCTVMQRTYSDQFQQMELRMLLAHTGRPIAETLAVFKASDADDCATQCALSKANSLSRSNVDGAGDDDDDEPCQSYDFCQPIKSVRGLEDRSSICILFKDHLVSSFPLRVKGDLASKPASRAAAAAAAAKRWGESPPNPADSLVSILKANESSLTMFSFCTHYSRNHLADFHRINRRRLPDKMKTLTLRNYELPPAPVETQSNVKDKGSRQVDSGTVDVQAEELGANGSEEPRDDVSLARCADLCEEDPNCGAFEYCLAKHEKAPQNLYLSCSLADESSFDLTPWGRTLAATSGRSGPAAGKTSLARSTICSVYVYRSLSLVLGHKKKNLARLSRKVELELAQVYRSSVWNLFRLDALILLAFFGFGFLARDLSTDQFTFRRFREASLDDGHTDENSIPNSMGFHYRLERMNSASAMVKRG